MYTSIAPFVQWSRNPKSNTLRRESTTKEEFSGLEARVEVDPISFLDLIRLDRTKNRFVLRGLVITVLPSHPLLLFEPWSQLQ